MTMNYMHFAPGSERAESELNRFIDNMKASLLAQLRAGAIISVQHELTGASPLECRGHTSHKLTISFTDYTQAQDRSARWQQHMSDWAGEFVQLEPLSTWDRVDDFVSLRNALFARPYIPEVPFIHEQPLTSGELRQELQAGASEPSPARFDGEGKFREGV